MIPETIFLRDGTQVNLIHLVTRVNGEWRISCMPGLKDFGVSPGRLVPHMHSDEKVAVTCPSCKATYEPKTPNAPKPQPIIGVVK
jgi:hypothetical protein